MLLFLYVLKGVGFLEVLSEDKFQFVGRNQSILNFMRFVFQEREKFMEEEKGAVPSKMKKSSTQTENPRCFKDQDDSGEFQVPNIRVEDQLIDVSSYNAVSLIVEKIIFAMLFDQNKILNKSHLMEFLQKHQ